MIGTLNGGDGGLGPAGELGAGGDEHGGGVGLLQEVLRERGLERGELGVGGAEALLLGGAEAAAQHYFRKSASRLSTSEAARLAVMLPAPKRFEKTPGSAYLSGRTRTIMGRMGSAELP